VDNSATLKLGEKKAKDIIARYVLNTILVPYAKQAIAEATQMRISEGHNMTGNTINSYAAGIYVQGELVLIQTSMGSIQPPLRRKLGLGEKFYPNQQRWDGEIQETLFKASVATNGTTEAERCIAFLQEYNAPRQGWTIVVCNGVEYASYQETQLGVDVLTNSYNSMQQPLFFNPID
jgi:hypothetical protein